MFQIQAAIIGGNSFVGNDDKFRVVLNVVCIVGLMGLRHRIFHPFHRIIEGIAKEYFDLVF